MNGKAGSLLFICTILLLFPLYAQENLVNNNSFERDDVLGNLTWWETDSFIQNSSSALIVPVEGISRTGKRSLLVLNYIPNDSRAVQWVRVQPNTVYRFSAWVYIEESGPQGKGANISVYGSIFPSDDSAPAKKEWQKIELVGKTGGDQTELPVNVRLGFFGRLSTGKVYFDDVEMIKLDAMPAGKVIDLSQNEGTGVVSYKEKKDEKQGFFENVNILLVIVTGALGFIVLLLVLQLFGVFGKIVKAVSGDKKSLPKKEPVTVDQKAALDKIERRRTPRKKIKLDIVLSRKMPGGGYEILELQTIDLSETGTLVKSEDLGALKIDDKVSCEIEYKKRRFDVGEAKVVRKEEIYDKKGKLKKSGFGLVFVSEAQPFLKNRKMLMKE
ncbi:MAG: PilZ domain-containing protein [Spirochaetales bacterium]|nr:PilZ domain-containing protein [Spirochaetales bacterium]